MCIVLRPDWLFFFLILPCYIVFTPPPKKKKSFEATEIDMKLLSIN